jgi:hypothetical protein
MGTTIDTSGAEGWAVVMGATNCSEIIDKIVPCPSTCSVTTPLVATHPPSLAP